jgi:translation initiation factor IF-3
MIRIPQVRVVDEEGAQLGIMPTPRALEMAQERGYDLVEVAPMASPPVVRFLDFGQYKYELTKREKEAKRRQRAVTFKEVRLTPKIGIGDFDTKVNRAVEFLEEGDRIKVTVRFRGRELTHPELGRNLLGRFAERIKDHGTVERAPTLEGKSMHITVASLHKPRVHEAPIRAAEGQPAASAPAETPAPVAQEQPHPQVEQPARPAETQDAPPAQAAANQDDGQPAQPAAQPEDAEPPAPVGAAPRQSNAPAQPPAQTGE